MGYFLFFLLAILVFFLLEKGLIKLFGVERKRISETAGKKIDQWGRGIIVFVSLSILVFVIEMDMDMDMDIYLKWYIICFYIISFGFKLVMERLYLKNTKQYVITLAFLVLTVPILYHTEHLIEQIKLFEGMFFK